MHYSCTLHLFKTLPTASLKIIEPYSKLIFWLELVFFHFPCCDLRSSHALSLSLPEPTSQHSFFLISCNCEHGFCKNAGFFFRSLFSKLVISVLLSSGHLSWYRVIRAQPNTPAEDFPAPEKRLLLLFTKGLSYLYTTMLIFAVCYC